MGIESELKNVFKLISPMFNEEVLNKVSDLKKEVSEKYSEDIIICNLMKQVEDRVEVCWG